MILILDFGSQYTQLIARRIREAQVYCEIYPGTKNINEIAHIKDVKGIILSGGHASVYEKEAPWPCDDVWKTGVPILGICYGMQLIAENFGGKVHPSKNREFGFADITVKGKNLLFDGLDKKMPVWISHGDKPSKISQSLINIASS